MHSSDICNVNDIYIPALGQHNAYGNQQKKKIINTDDSNNNQINNNKNEDTNDYDC